MQSKLELIFDDIEVLITDRGYMRLPNETPLLFAALDTLKIVSLKRCMTLWYILTHKHDEKNPFPSHERLMKHFGLKDRAVKAAIADLVNAGLVTIEKGLYGTDSRKNTYNMTNFLNLLGSFVEKFRNGEEPNVAELVKDVVAGKTEAKKAIPQESKPENDNEGLSEEVIAALDTVKPERRSTIAKVAKKHLSRLKESTVILYIKRVDERCTDEEKLYTFASVCFKNAKDSDVEKAKKEKPVYNTDKKNKKKDELPKWLEEERKAQQEAAAGNEAPVVEEEVVVEESTSKTYETYKPYKAMILEDTGLDIDHINCEEYETELFDWHVSARYKIRELQKAGGL